MLHKQTVSHSLLTILKNLMQDELLNDFILVGRTSLALRYGHRDSEDIDLFTSKRLPINIFTAFGEIDLADKSKMPNMYKNYEWNLVKDKLKKYAKKYFLNL